MKFVDRINICGKVDLVCFDKTGTLTEDQLSVYGVGCQGDRNGFSTYKTMDEIVIHSEKSGLLPQMLASCHSVRDLAGELVGDPLDIEMLKFSKWKYRERVSIQSIQNSFIAECNPPDEWKHSHESLFILKRFDFSSETRRMSAITKIGNDIYIFVKELLKLSLSYALKNLVSRI